MKKLILILLCLLLAVPAWADEAEAPKLEGKLAIGEVTGDFDQPALSDPEARYTDYFVEETDGSEVTVFSLIDFMNDEAEDMKDGGALLITENWIIDDNSPTAMVTHLRLQQSPYGAMIIATSEMAGTTMYCCGEYAFIDDGETLTPTTGFSADEMEFYTTSYHFPYGRLECLQGVRQDANGYTYFFVRSDDTLCFEFVIGEQMRVIQTRMYARDDAGDLHLNNFVDYETGEAPEIPQDVLDAFGEVMEPAADAASEPEQTDENGDNP